MKTKIYFLVLTFFLGFSFAQASFPVKRSVKVDESKEIMLDGVESEMSTPVASSTMAYDKTVAILLWVFLWPFAAHRWYAGKPIGYNILFILTLGGFFVWAVIDLVNIIKGDF
ncbi:hypothetical protein HME9304_02672 [Flagellimonas maritima]|uniref:TM2 domain-containing protein n=1 Tax=Flagellimonas maritima TaxID=1383885 RepID=A0A2Z4LUR1_9FLAO|nr:TM2 domain-containing protein [Allomuricauda aurantiaca]AWX45645.1 hypothetical protein HME9304_02672 [Allomuricauda aurantiaca]